MARVKKESGTSAPEKDAYLAGIDAAGAPSDAASALSKDALEMSAKLTTVLEESDRTAAADVARASFRENVNAAKEVPVDPRFPALVEKTFAPSDWLKAIDRYEKWLSLGDHRTEEAHIRKAHEEGPSILQSLHDAYFQVKYAREQWELENDVVFGAMREEASKVLQGEKSGGVRTKQITEKDVDAKCSALFSDEWVRQESKRSRFKIAEDRTKSCVEVAAVRCRVLDGMMGKLR